MTSIDFRVRRFLAAAVVSVLAAAPSSGAGFGIFQQGAKAMGMAGAFTAQADDPSAMFHNVGGLAHQKDRSFQLGATFVSVSSTEFTGGPPGIAVGVREESEPLFTVPPHFYWVEPLGERWTFGLALNSTFGLTSEWTAAGFSGRFISRKAALTSYDISPNLAWRVSDTLGVGFGAIVRFSDLELMSNVPALDPAAGQVVDIAEFRLDSALDSGVGFQVGISSHPNNSWSWGLSYRSKIEVDYGGDGRLRQIATSNPGLDAFVAATVPFGADLPFTTTIEFPDLASFGIAIKPSVEWLVELDFNWAGWSSVTEYAIRLPQNPEFGRTFPQNWEDVYSYRLGASRAGRGGAEWRFGVSIDETPQPLEALGPILPDGNQEGLTLGYGMSTRSTTVDFALMYLAIEKRTTTVNSDDYNGSYDSSAVLFASTVTW